MSTIAVSKMRAASDKLSTQYVDVKRVINKSEGELESLHGNLRVLGEHLFPVISLAVEDTI